MKAALIILALIIVVAIGVPVVGYFWLCSTPIHGVC